MLSPDNMSIYLKMMLLLRDGLIGGLAGFIAYLFDYQKARKEGDKNFVFRPSSLLINISLGAYVGYNVGTVLEPDMEFRDLIVSLSGLTAYSILLLAQSKFAGWLFDRANTLIKK